MPEPAQPPPARRTVYAGHIVNLVIEAERWEIVEHAPAVVILALQDGQMLLVRQQRYGAGLPTLEAPAGLIDRGESPLEAAGRELSEECNLGGDLTLISQCYTSPGFCDEYIYLFEAKNLVTRPGTPDQDENIEVVWMKPRNFIEQVRDGTIKTSAPALVAAMHALLAQQG
jgi:ADP-ribose pyrophosphatase